MSAKVSQLKQPTDGANSALTHNSEEDSALTKPYKATPEETAARDAVRARRVKKVPRVKITLTPQSEGVLKGDWELDDPNQSVGHYLLMDAIGAPETDFYAGVVSYLLRASTHGQRIEEAEVNFMLGVIKAVHPRDELETMLAAQMATVHALTMEFSRRLHSAESLVQQDSAERTLNKLFRTFTTQMEALKRHRANGEQRVIVEHLHVGQGGQAVVAGNINRTGVGSSEKPG
jgi:hypothetical protein